MIGAGRRFDEVEAALELLVAEMNRRYEMLRDGQDGFEPMTIAVDELSAFASNIPNGAQHLITIAQEGRKVRMFVILTPHSPEVRQLGFEGKGGARDSFVFVKMPVIRPGEEQKQRVVTVYYGNPLTTEPDGRYIVPPPIVYQGEPRLISAEELGEMLGVSGHVSESGHGRDTGKTLVSPDDEGYAARYGRGSQEALDLAVYLVGHGYGVRKIGEVLPYRVEDARATAAEAMAYLSPNPSPERGGGRRAKPIPGSQAEAQMIRELHFAWGAPVNRLARLLDGADHLNIGRVQEMLRKEGVK